MKEIIRKILLEKTETDIQVIGGGEEIDIIKFKGCNNCNRDLFLSKIAGEISSEISRGKITDVFVGIIFKSNSSGAIYYWKYGDDHAEVIVATPSREKGMKIPCTRKVLSENINKLFRNSDERLWEIIKVVDENNKSEKQ